MYRRMIALVASCCLILTLAALPVQADEKVDGTVLAPGQKYTMSGKFHVETIGTKKYAVLSHLESKYYARTCLMNPPEGEDPCFLTPVSATVLESKTIDLVKEAQTWGPNQRVTIEGVWDRLFEETSRPRVMRVSKLFVSSLGQPGDGGCWY
jgi:hypothetical protein